MNGEAKVDRLNGEYQANQHDSVPYRGGLREIAAFAAILIAAILTRLLFLGKESLWWDEAVSVRLAQMDWRHLGDALWHGGEFHMTLYYVLLHFWIALGQTEFLLRALSVVFGVATVPLFYLFGRQLFGRQTGLVAALLLTLNVFHIRYTQEVRSYALLMLLATLSSFLFVRGLQRPSWKTWTAYAITGALSAYSHPFAALVLIAHAVSLGFLRRRDVPWKLVLVSGGVIVLLLVPLGIVAPTKGYEPTPKPGPDAIPRLLTYLAGAAPVSTPVASSLFATAGIARRLLMALYAGGVALALWRAAQRWRGGRTSHETWVYLFLITWLLVPPILAYAASSVVKPIFSPNYLLVSLPPLVFLAADGFSHIQRPEGRAAALILFVGLALLQAFAYYAYGKREDWRGATAFILSQTQPGDGIIFYTGSVDAFEYYRSRLRRPSSTTLLVPSMLSDDDPQRDRYRRLWLVLSHDDGRGASIQSAVAAGRSLVEEKRFESQWGEPIRVLLYQAPN